MQWSLDSCSGVVMFLMPTSGKVEILMVRSSSARLQVNNGPAPDASVETPLVGQGRDGSQKGQLFLSCAYGKILCKCIYKLEYRTLGESMLLQSCSTMPPCRPDLLATQTREHWVTANTELMRGATLASSATLNRNQHKHAIYA